MENDAYKMYWGKGIFTDTHTTHNRPADITIINKTKKRIYLLDISIPNNHNVSKYHDLSIEIKQMWHKKEVKMIPLKMPSIDLIPNSYKS